MYKILKKSNLEIEVSPKKIEEHFLREKIKYLNVMEKEIFNQTEYKLSMKKEYNKKILKKVSDILLQEEYFLKIQEWDFEAIIPYYSFHNEEWFTIEVIIKTNEIVEDHLNKKYK